MLLKRHPLFAFFILGLVLGVPLNTVHAVAGRVSTQAADGVALFLNYGPALAAVVALAGTSGRAGVRELFAAALRWRVGVRWYAFVLLQPTVVWIGAGALDTLLAGTAPRAGTLSLSPLLLPALLLGAVHDLGEEVGWRGYALPLLLQSHGAPVASLVVATMWVAWHLPMFWLGGVFEKPFPIGWWVLSLAAYAILFTWVYVHTGGSVLLAALFHAAINLSAGLLPGTAPGEDGWRLYALGSWLTLAMAVCVAGAQVGGRMHRLYSETYRTAKNWEDG